MKRLFIITCCAICHLLTAHPLIETRIRIAIIDTGIDLSNEVASYMCKYGHYNFINNTYDIQDTHGHGTNIAWLITRNLDPKKYCLLIYKYYNSGGINNLINAIKAFQAAIDHSASYINFSSGGPNPSPAERKVIEDALQRHIRITVAAGNDSNTICTPHTHYPACYKIDSPHFYVIGNCKDGEYADSSNRGPDVKYCENGGRQGDEKSKMSGTSQSTAIFMNKLILREEEKTCTIK